MEVPKIGDPNVAALNSRILIIKASKKGTPNFRKLPLGGAWVNISAAIGFRVPLRVL